MTVPLELGSHPATCTSYLSSQSLGFLICAVGITIGLISQGAGGFSETVCWGLHTHPAWCVAATEAATWAVPRSPVGQEGRHRALTSPWASWGSLQQAESSTAPFQHQEEGAQGWGPCHWLVGTEHPSAYLLSTYLAGQPLMSLFTHWCFLQILCITALTVRCQHVTFLKC